MMCGFGHAASGATTSAGTMRPEAFPEASGGTMETIDAIHARRSQSNVEPEPISRAQIEVLLDAAVQAPNHYKVRPWRFAVVAGKGREAPR